MRVRVTGSNRDAVRLLSDLLEDPRVGYTVAEIWPRYTVYLESSAEMVSVDGVDSDLESRIVDNIAELTGEPLLLKRAGGIRNEQEIRIGVPDRLQEKVVQGTLRGLMQLGKRRKFWGLF